MKSVYINCKFSELEKKLYDLLPEKRYRHTIGVTYTCASLAMRYDADIKKAMIAGYFHDYAKYMSSKEILQKCIELSLPVSEAEKKCPQLLHGKLGAYYAKRDFDLNDEEIIKAITYHTSGCLDMSMIGKILYIADYIEPNRKKIEDIDIIRKMAFEDIDKAIILKIDSCLAYLKDNNKAVDDLTLQTYDYYKDICEKKK